MSDPPKVATSLREHVSRDPASGPSASAKAPLGGVLTFVCADGLGIVAAVAGFLADHDGFILDSQQFADVGSGRFFMRVAFTAAGPRFPATLDVLAARFRPVGDRFALDWSMHAVDARPRVVVAVSKASHCLNDLLHRWLAGFLSVEIVAVVSNHEDLRPLVRWYDLPFHHLPVDDASRADQESALLDVLEGADAEYLVLARYMQVLSGGAVARLAGRCVNIHHGFLPGFKGALPYHRAHERGVKLIGATAHFVTSELDEGPIIEQAVERVDHRASVDEMIRIGRDIESRVLARAVTWIGERRVLLNGDRTVVFR